MARIFKRTKVKQKDQTEYPTKPKNKKTDIQVVKFAKFGSIKRYPTNNCKFCVLDNVGHYIEKKGAIEAIKVLVPVTNTFFVHVLHKKYIDILSKHFTMIYCVKVPIGYNGKHQYHALFHQNNFQYTKRIEKEGIGLLTEKQITKILSYKTKGYLRKFLNKLKL